MKPGQISQFITNGTKKPIITKNTFGDAPDPAEIENLFSVLSKEFQTESPDQMIDGGRNIRATWSLI